MKLNGCLKASQRQRKKTRLTACAGEGEGEGSVRSIELGTEGICIRVCASRGKHASSSSMLQMTASDSVSQIFQTLIHFMVSLGHCPSIAIERSSK